MLVSIAATGMGATISDDFSSDPSLRGWRVFGSSNLFSWDSIHKRISVTWDSSQPNGYYYVPLGTILTRLDDFSMAFDLELNDAQAGIDPAKSSTFELAAGMLNLVDATRTNFYRGNGHASPNLVEFDYFPDADPISATVWPSIWSTNSTLNYSGSSDYTVMELPLGVVMRVTMNYTASNRTLTTSILTNGTPVAAVGAVQLSSTFTDFRVGCFAIESYSGAGQDPQFGGSLLAHGWIGNVLVTVPDPPVKNISGKFVSGQWQASFLSRNSWLYRLERTIDLKSWAAVTALTNGTGAAMTLVDTNRTMASGFYRVSAQLP
jgi:hypothetical protein